MLKRNWKLITVLVLSILLPMLVLNFGMVIPFFDSLSNADNSARLGFWGGYLGSIVAVIGVFWQVREEIKNNRKMELEKVRPIFLLDIMDGSEENKSGFTNSNIILLNTPAYLSIKFLKAMKFNDEKIISTLTNNALPFIQLKNISSNSMLAVNILLSWANEKNKENFFIGRIEQTSTISLVTSGTLEYYNQVVYHGQRVKDADLRRLEYFEIYYLTEHNEKIYYKYKINQGYDEPELIDQKSESKGDDFTKSEYKIHNRIENRRICI